MTKSNFAVLPDRPDGAPETLPDARGGADRACVDVVLVDLCAWSGHHSIYFLRVFQELESLGMRVAGLCLEPEDFRKAYRKETGGEPHMIRLRAPSFWAHALVGFANRLWRRFTGRNMVRAPYHAKNLLTAHRSLGKADIPAGTLVFFLHLDSMLLTKPAWLAKRLFPKNWIGLYFLPACRLPRGNAQRVIREARERVFGSDRCKGIFLLDEGAVGDVRRKVAAGFVEPLPELTNFDLKRDFELPAPLTAAKRRGATIVGLYGGINKRKNVLNLLRAVDRLGVDAFHLAIAGQFILQDFSDDERDEFHARAANATVSAVDQFLPDEGTFNAFIDASDIIFLAYRDFVGSSNILVKAAHFRKPVIVSRGFLISERVERYGLGIAIDQDDVDAIANAIVTLSNGHAFDEDKLRTFLAMNDEATFRAKLALLPRHV